MGYLEEENLNYRKQLTRMTCDRYGTTRERSECAKARTTLPSKRRMAQNATECKNQCNDGENGQQDASAKTKLT